MALGMIINTANAQTVSAPIDVQIDLIPKILSLDKNFNSLNESENCNIGIVYSSRLRSSTKIKNEIMDYTSGKEIAVKKCNSNIFPIDVSKDINIRKFIEDNNIKAVYIAPLRGYNIKALTKICKEKKVRTFTGVNSFFNEDISVMFDLHNNKLEIHIDLSSVKDENAKFSSYLLNIAQLKE